MPNKKNFTSNLPILENDQFWIKYNVIDLLNTFPIYDFFTDNSREKEVVVCSDVILTEQAQLFINYVLQFCQSDRYEIKVTVLTDDPKETERVFLLNKPAVPRFISINGNELDDSIGSIDFKSLDELPEVLANENCRYFFISFEDEEENNQIASEIKGSFNNNELFLIVSDYENDEVDYYINEEFDFSQDLTSLALNLHLSYIDKNYSSAAEEYHRFLQEYNFLSSLLGVVSINYKLNSIGINPENDSSRIHKTLEEFEEVKDSVTDELAYIEHRRWTIEKIFDGYEAFNEEDFEKIVTEDKSHFELEDRKIHFCVVPSVKDFPLENIPKEEWDEYIPGEESFDELDKVSLKVHRILKDAAFELKENKAETDSIIEEVESDIQKSSMSTKNQFQLVQMYYDRLFNLNNSQAYCNLKDSVSNLLKTINKKKILKQVSPKLEFLLNKLEPINRYLNPRDYKNYDKDIVENISYIFNNRFREKLGLGFQIEYNSNDRFQNVASLTVLFPSEVVYFTYLNEDSELRTLYQHFKNIADYIRRRIPDCKIKLDVLLSDEVSEDAINELSKSLAHNQRFNDNYIFEIVQVPNIKEAQEWIRETIKKENVKVLDAQPKIFGNEDIDVDFKRDLRAEGLPEFRFDSEKGEFEYIENCSYLNYLRTDNFIINLYDIFQIGNAYMYYDIPKFSEETIESLWKLVTGLDIDQEIEDPKEYEINVAHWNELGERLDKYNTDKLADKSNNLRHLIRMPIELDSWRSYTNDFVIPKDLQASFLYLFDSLYKEGYLNSKPVRIDYNDDFIKFEIDSDYQYLIGRLSDVLSKFKSRMSEREKLKIYTRDNDFGENEVFILEYNDLEVKDFQLVRPNGDFYDVGKFKKILRNLNNLGLIENLEIDDKYNTVSFNYKDVNSKELILTSGKVLELYCYYILSQSSLFDEIATGVRIENKETGETNEFDLIAIKGSRAFIIECKQTKELKQCYIHKLRSLSLDYNINSRGILIVNNYANGRNLKRDNEINKKRAIRDRIDVINEPNEIVNLVDSMERIINKEVYDEL